MDIPTVESSLGSVREKAILSKHQHMLEDNIISSHRRVRADAYLNDEGDLFRILIECPFPLVPPSVWLYDGEKLLPISGRRTCSIWLPFFVFVGVGIVTDPPNYKRRDLIHNSRCLHLEAEDLILFCKLLRFVPILDNLVARGNSPIVNERMYDSSGRPVN